MAGFLRVAGRDCRICAMQHNPAIVAMQHSLGTQIQPGFNLLKINAL
jgi:hypothetical protein